MKGAIYLVGSKVVKIQNCTFSKNDAGPLFNSLQMVGMLNNRNQYGNVQRASSIYVDRGAQAVEITDCEFFENHQDFLLQYVKQNNIDLFNYFPPDYFSSSHAPQVNVHMNEYSAAPCNISLIGNLFHDQKNTAILGFSRFNESYVDTTYWAQLLAIRTRSSNSIIEFSNNTVYNYIYKGRFSSLIHKSFSGELRAQNNIFFNIGFKATTNDKLKIPVKPPATRRFDFTSEQVERAQEVGIFAFSSNSLGSPG